MGYRNYSVTNGFTVDKAGNGDFTTISSALSAASSGDVIGIRPGTYTENINLIAGITLVTLFEATPGSPILPVDISGQVTCTGGGNVNLRGINFTSNGANLISISGSTATTLHFQGCQLQNQASFTILTCNNANAVVYFDDCIISSGDSGTALFTITSCNSVYVQGGTKQYNAAAASTIAAGTWTLWDAAWSSPITSSGTGGLLFYYAQLFQVSNNTITCGGSGTHQFYYSIFSGNTASAITINTTVNLIGCKVSSSNTNALTGSGTVIYDIISYLGSSSTNNVSTQTALTTQPALGGTSFVVQQIRANTTTNTTGTTTFTLGSNPTTSGGTQILSAAITPTNSSHILEISYEYFVFYNHTTTTADSGVISALFQSGSSSAIYSQVDICVPTLSASGGFGANVKGRYYMTAGTTSSTTFTVRIGMFGSANNWYFLETEAGTNTGSQFASIFITEYTS